MKIDLLKSNLILKIVALLGAVFLWLYVLNANYKVAYLENEVAIKPFNLTENLLVTSDLGTVTLKVRAPLAAWTKIKEEKITAYVDLKDLKPGTYSLEVSAVVDDPAIQILEKKPAALEVVIDETSALERDLVVRLEGQAGQGYSAAEPEIADKTVTVKGGKAALEKVTQVLAVVKLNGETSDFSQTVELEARDKNNVKVTSVAIFPKNIEVKVPVAQENNFKTVGVKAKLKGKVETGYWLAEAILEPETVTLQGRSARLKDVSYLETAVIDLTGLKSETRESVEIILPEGVTIEGTGQVTVRLVIKSGESSREFSLTPQFKNLKSGLKVVSFKPSRARVVVFGETDLINKTKESDLTPSFNLKDKEKGNYDLTLKKENFNLPKGLEIKEIKESEIVVVLE